MNKLKDIKKILASIATVLETVEAGEPASAPVQEADKNPEAMWNLLHDCKASIKGLHACMSSMADDMYAHMDSSKHLPAMKNWEHMDYACKQLGFHKETAIRHAAYASKKVVIG